MADENDNIGGGEDAESHPDGHAADAAGNGAAAACPDCGGAGEVQLLLTSRGPGGADWKREVTAEAYWAACLAIREFDPGRGVGLPGFVARRVLTAVWTMHRRERSYRRRSGGGGRDEPFAGLAASAGPEGYPIMAPHLAAALERLSGPSRRLLMQVFWEGRRAADIAAEEGVSKRAVNLRIEAALSALRAELRVLARGQASRN